MLLTAEFWVAVAFVAFLVIVWRVGGFSMMTSGLDNRAKRVRHELDEARRLREEAAAVLADYKRRRTEAEGQTRLNEFVARRTKSAEAKIAQAEATATAQVRAAAADAAVKVSETILRERLQGAAAQDLVRASLGDVKSRLQA